jgi:lysyl-tRNA synthetase class 2
LKTDHWQPSATIETLKKRAAMLALIRQFFAQREVFEVDVAVLSANAVSDPYIDSMAVSYRHFPEDSLQEYYLQSSPEYAMKRLLAANSGCIYQMSKVFRNGEIGRKHNPEFTMLEWYRLGFDEQELMCEVAELITLCCGISHFNHFSYQQLFEQFLAVDIYRATDAELGIIMNSYVEVKGIQDRDTWLNMLMSHCIEPQLMGAVFVYDYPASQSALARLKADQNGRQVAARFELFIDGIELANGYHELTDADQQKKRLEADQQQRKILNLPQRPLETRLVSALQQGLPDCAGVALGVDRLMMLALKKDSINEVLAFDFSRA